MEFDLKKIAEKLESLEETIIFRCIDRFQYAVNDAVYRAGQFSFKWSSTDSLLDYKHRFAEETDAVLGRFQIAEERPFFDNLPAPAVSLRETADEGLIIPDFNRINLTAAIKTAYLDFIHRTISVHDDGEYGTTVELDIALLQAISRRVHYGAFFVAEAKYRDNPKIYDAPAAEKKAAEIRALLTRKPVEDAIIERIREKVDHIQKVSDPRVRRKLNPESLAAFYRDCIIPLTKDGEVAYLMQRSTAGA
ncbi:MAG: chorismate mutase [Fibrobacterota bacterium]